MSSTQGGRSKPPRNLAEAIKAINDNTDAMEKLGTKVDRLTASNVLYKRVLLGLGAIVIALAAVVGVLIPTTITASHASTQATRALDEVPAATCQVRNDLRATDLRFFERLSNELETPPLTATDLLINGFIAKAYAPESCPKT
jgi:hypothetical protein